MPEYAQLIPVSEWIGRGDVIRSKNSGRLYRVIKVNSVNYRSLDVNGAEWNVNKRNAVKATPDQKADFEAREKKVEKPEVGPPLTIGNVIRFISPSDKQRFGAGKFVVIKLLADDYYQVVMLNGNGNRYVKHHRSAMELTTAE